MLLLLKIALQRLYYMYMIYNKGLLSVLIDCELK